MCRVCKLPLAINALQANHNSASITFPKFVELVHFLQGMVDRTTTMHGIVFVTERQGVYVLANMLRGLPDLAEKATVHTFTGHPAKSNMQLMAEGATAGTVTAAIACLVLFYFRAFCLLVSMLPVVLSKKVCQ